MQPRPLGVPPSWVRWGLSLQCPHLPLPLCPAAPQPRRLARWACPPAGCFCAFHARLLTAVPFLLPPNPVQPRLLGLPPSWARKSGAEKRAAERLQAMLVRVASPVGLQLAPPPLAAAL